MLALGIVLSIVGLGFFCWLLFTLAIYALPFFVGMTVGLYAHQAGSGPLGAFCLALLPEHPSLLSDTQSSRSSARRSCAFLSH